MAASAFDGGTILSAGDIRLLGTPFDAGSIQIDTGIGEYFATYPDETGLIEGTPIRVSGSGGSFSGFTSPPVVAPPLASFQAPVCGTACVLPRTTAVPVVWNAFDAGYVAVSLITRPGSPSTPSAGVVCQFASELGGGIVPQAAMSQLFAVTDAGGRGFASFYFGRSVTFDAGGPVQFEVNDSFLKQLRTP